MEAGVYKVDITKPKRRVPRHQLAASIRQFIHEQGLVAGDQLPSEPDLARHFGVACNTLRGALDELAQSNVLLRRHGAGTFVQPQTATQTIGLLSIIPHITHGTSVYWQWALRHLGMQSREHALATRLMVINEEGGLSASDTAAARRHEIAGALMLTISLGPEENYRRLVAPLERLGIPVVAINKDRPEPLHRTLMDHTMVFDAIGQWLAERGRHRIAARLPPASASAAFADMWNSLIRRGIHITAMPDLACSALEPLNSTEKGRQHYHWWRDCGAEPLSRPATILLMDHYVAQGFMYEQLACEGRIPATPHMVVMEATEATLPLPWPVTRIQYSHAEVMDRSVELLASLMAGKRPEQRLVHTSVKDVHIFTQ
ncbi:MAG: GntR family transcriptional regulator [Phycisphaeraceae bacterium]|nr:GntR family transcriptional regulator [Phycisphaeraceae bacterium]